MNRTKRVSMVGIAFLLVRACYTAEIPQIAQAKDGEEIVLIDLSQPTVQEKIRNAVRASRSSQAGTSSGGMQTTSADARQDVPASPDALALVVLRFCSSRSQDRGAPIPQVLLSIAKQADAEAVPLKEIPDELAVSAREPTGTPPGPPKQGQLVLRGSSQGPCEGGRP